LSIKEATVFSHETVAHLGGRKTDLSEGITTKCLRLGVMRQIARTADVDGFPRVKHYECMSTLADIEKAVEKLSSQQKQELIQFLDALLRAESNGRAIRSLPPADRAVDLKRWAASHEPGPGLPDSAIGRDAIYD
jgi:hypothetical protein